MATRGSDLLEDLKEFVAGYGIDVRSRQMDEETPGEFDGPTITLNPIHDREALAFYLAHAFGSIYQWSVDDDRARQVFDGLREAKRGPSPDGRFEAALARWRQFEQTSSDHAVWALGQIDHPGAIRPYTVFFRADIEAMTIFHRTGKEPRWPDFFADWKRQVAAGAILIEPFDPKPVAPFTPAKIEKQEVVQEQD